MIVWSICLIFFGIMMMVKIMIFLQENMVWFYNQFDPWELHRENDQTFFS